MNAARAAIISGGVAGTVVAMLNISAVAAGAVRAKSVGIAAGVLSVVAVGVVVAGVSVDAMDAIHAAWNTPLVPRRAHVIGEPVSMRSLHLAQIPGY
jgi:hypothetical protein